MVIGHACCRSRESNLETGAMDNTSTGSTTDDDEDDRSDDISTYTRNIPRDCRIRCIAYLRPHELYGAYAKTSRQCHEDSGCGSLPQIYWGEVICGSEVVRFLERLAHPSCQEAFSRPRTRMKLLGHTDMLRPDVDFEQIESLARNAMLLEVTTLDLSVSSRRLERDEDASFRQRMHIHRVPMPFHPRSLSWALARALPNLVELDLSNLSGGPREEGDSPSELSIFNHENCPRLSKIVWRNRIGGCRFLRGNDLRTLQNLREINLDGLVADFRYDGGFGANTYGFFMECAGHDSDRCIFFRCNNSLERLSLIGAKYVDQETLNEHPLPQSMLIKFVQNTPTLKWLRSDLKRANVQMLRNERPGVVICSGEEKW